MSIHAKCLGLAALALLGLLPFLLAQDKDAAPAGTTPVALPGAEQIDLKAKNGGTYRLFIAGPRSAPPAAGFPVIYVLDGNEHFATVLSASSRGPGGLQGVVVGVGYPGGPAEAQQRRMYDLTPPTPEAWLAILPRKPEKVGGCDEMLAFLLDEVKPLVEQKYKIDKSRQALFGHSLGGLFTLHALFAKPEAFQTYLASSPSIWWNDRSLLEEAKSFADKQKTGEVKARVLVTVGAWEQNPSPTEPANRHAMLKSRKQVDNARELVALLNQQPPKGLSASFKLFEEEDHGSVVLAAISRGVRLALEAPRP